MPLLPSGRCDVIEVAEWIVENISPGRGVNRSIAVKNARRLLADRPGLSADDVSNLRRVLLMTR
jgi:hypothetical protein